jgi:tetratricopeptide (TPR) repeat protein
MRQGRLQQASASFQEALHCDPGHFWARYCQAVCCLQRKHFGEARVGLTACLQKRDFVWAYALRGYAQGELGNIPAAEQDFEKALHLPDVTADARYAILVNRGALRTRQGRLEKALEDLGRAIKEQPQRYQAYLNLAQAYQKRDQLKLTSDVLDRALTVARQARQAGELEPAALVRLYQERARLNLTRKLPGKALADLDEAVRVEAPASPSVSVSSSDLDEAVRMEVASPQSPTLAESQILRARILYEQQRYADAVHACDQALRASPTHAEAYCWRADALYGEKKYAEARNSFDSYLKVARPRLKPEVLAHVYLGRGLTRIWLDDYPGAIDDYNHALWLLPDSSTHTHRGWAYLALKNLEMALRDFDEAIRLDRKNADARCGRGLVQAKRGRVWEARAEAAHALKLVPESDRVLLNVAHIHAQIIRRIGASGPRNRLDRLQSQDQALRVLRRALDRQPTPQDRVAFWRKHVRGADRSLVGTLSDHPQFAMLDAQYSRPAR